MKNLFLLCLILSMVAVANASLLTWWQMDDVAEGSKVVPDSMGNMDGDIRFTDTVYPDDGCLSFNGGDWGRSQVNCDESIFSQVSDEITIALWAKCDPTNSRWQKNHCMFSGKSGGADLFRVEFPGSDLMLWTKNLDTGVTEYKRIYGFSNPEDSDYVPFDQWNHYAFSKSAISGKIQIHVNGVLVGESNSAGDLAGCDYFALTDSSGTPGSEWTGWMKDFRIYNTQLSTEEIAAIVPEPATIALLSLGGLVFIRKRK